MLRITRAKRGDLPDLVELLGRLFAIEQDFRPGAARQLRGLELLIRMPRRALVLVARDGSGQAIGLATAQLVISTSEGALSVWIEDVIVAENHRGLGLGRALIQRLLSWARQQGATRAQLLVDIDNAPAVSFYDRLGWQPTRLAARRIFLKITARRPKKTGAP
jgi:GNAT superfamily N-acetyltransferase